MTTRAEVLSHVAQEQALKALFESHPFEVLTHAQLVAEVGENFRSRLTWVRRQLGVIDLVPVKLADGTRGYGSYVYRPNALGPDAADLSRAVPIDLPLFHAHVAGWQE